MQSTNTFGVLYKLTMSCVLLIKLSSSCRLTYDVNLGFSTQNDRDVQVIHVEHDNTVKSLRDQLQSLINDGKHDSGFPILRSDHEGSRMVGYIGANELEHALSKYSIFLFERCPYIGCLIVCALCFCS